MKKFFNNFGKYSIMQLYSKTFIGTSQIRKKSWGFLTRYDWGLNRSL